MFTHTQIYNPSLIINITTKWSEWASYNILLRQKSNFKKTIKSQKNLLFEIVYGLEELYFLLHLQTEGFFRKIGFYITSNREMSYVGFAHVERFLQDIKC